MSQLEKIKDLSSACYCIRSLIDQDVFDKDEEDALHPVPLTSAVKTLIHEQLISDGLEYDPNLSAECGRHEDKKFFAAKITPRDNAKSAFEVVYPWIDEKASKHLKFNVVSVDYLLDKDSRDYLIRGLVVFAEKRLSLEDIRSMDVGELREAAESITNQLKKGIIK